MGHLRGWGCLPHDARMRDVMATQDNLYTLLTHSPGRPTRRPASSARFTSICFAPDAPQAVIDKLADPHTKIVLADRDRGRVTSVNDANRRV